MTMSPKHSLARRRRRPITITLLGACYSVLSASAMRISRADVLVSSDPISSSSSEIFSRGADTNSIAIQSSSSFSDLFDRDISLHKSLTHPKDDDVAAFNEVLHKLRIPIPDVSVPIERKILWAVTFDLEVYDLECAAVSAGAVALDAAPVTPHRDYGVALNISAMIMTCTGTWDYDMTGWWSSGTGTVSVDVTVESLAASYGVAIDTGSSSYSAALTECATAGQLHNLEIRGTGLGVFAPLFETRLEKEFSERMEEEICNRATN
eukprot:CAMPEP_0194289024 /NCGR_PEP_ID=MMETSP0169-20130528/38188_1 /TAXON_ID=218684 /ORGANISM="Corethron pennatum, Strain L29A3" /LENGTH=264 /DNA_ID=CAMNT_0039036201 /DNA_START=10 /DNA_END=801 /DNA_ORIENTATION=-